MRPTTCRPRAGRDVPDRASSSCCGSTATADDLDDQGHLTALPGAGRRGDHPEVRQRLRVLRLPIAEQTVKQAGYGRTAEVFRVGVQSIDSDSAVAIVAGGLTSSYPDPKHPDDASNGSGRRTCSAEVDLVKTDGAWLVDGYAPVTGRPGMMTTAPQLVRPLDVEP